MVKYTYLLIFSLPVSLPLAAGCGSDSTDEGSGEHDSDMHADSSSASNSDTSIDSDTALDTNQDTGFTTDVDSDSDVSDPVPLTNPESGFATHYWDCCKPHCGWNGNASSPVQSCDQDDTPIDSFDETSACNGGAAFQCWNYAPFAVSDTLAYGFAAHNGVDCGTCFQLEFSGTGYHNPSDPGAATLSNKFMIVQVVNIGGIAEDQFDLLIPGGGVGDFDACTRQWGVSDLGERYGGYFLQCRKENIGNLQDTISCVKSKCNSTFAEKKALLKACHWWAEWASVADNPNLRYGKVDCPSALRAISGM